MIYISGALNGSADLKKARAKYERVAEFLAETGLEPYLPHKKTDPVVNRALSSQDVYLADASAIDCAQAAIVFLDEPSLGVGLELAVFVRRGVPLLVLYDQRIEPSRFARGFLQHSGVEIVVYCTDPLPSVRGWVSNSYQLLAA